MYIIMFVLISGNWRKRALDVHMTLKNKQTTGFVHDKRENVSKMLACDVFFCFVCGRPYMWMNRKFAYLTPTERK